jgi:hypothetical protein
VEQNDAGLVSIGQTVPKLSHLHVLASMNFIDGKIKCASLTCSQNSRKFSHEQNVAGLESITILQGSLHSGKIGRKEMSRASRG